LLRLRIHLAGSIALLTKLTGNLFRPTKTCPEFHVPIFVACPSSSTWSHSAPARIYFHIGQNAGHRPPSFFAPRDGPEAGQTHYFVLLGGGRRRASSNRNRSAGQAGRRRTEKAAHKTQKSTAPAVEPADLRQCPSWAWFDRRQFARAGARKPHIGVWIRGRRGTSGPPRAVWPNAGLRAAFVGGGIVIPASEQPGTGHCGLRGQPEPAGTRADGLARGKPHVVEGAARRGLGPPARAWRDRPSGTRTATPDRSGRRRSGPCSPPPGLGRCGTTRLTTPAPQVSSDGRGITAPFPPPTFRSFNGWWKADARGGRTPAEIERPATLRRRRCRWEGQRTGIGRDRTYAKTDLHNRRGLCQTTACARRPGAQPSPR